MRLLYIGSASGTSLKRFLALQANGHDCSILDPKAMLPLSRHSSRWSYKTGALGISMLTYRDVLREVRNRSPFELVLVDNGESISPQLVLALKATGAKVALLNLDNPFSRRDGLRFRLVRRSIASYDAFFTPRVSTAQEALRRGAENVFTFWQAADDELATRGVAGPGGDGRFDCFVSFTGTWMERRDAFFQKIIAGGIDVRINGPRWQKAPCYASIRDNVCLGALAQEDFYAAIRASKVSIGLLSEENDDQHTTRSIEIPSLKSLLVAPRTADHLALYEDGREAFFWDDSQECIEILHRLHKDRALVAATRQRGHERALFNNNFNRPLMKSVVAAIFDQTGGPDAKARRVRLVNTS